jgi:TonB family protein
MGRLMKRLLTVFAILITVQDLVAGNKVLDMQVSQSSEIDNKICEILHGYWNHGGYFINIYQEEKEGKWKFEEGLWNSDLFTKGTITRTRKVSDTYILTVYFPAVEPGELGDGEEESISNVFFKLSMKNELAIMVSCFPDKEFDKYTWAGHDYETAYSIGSSLSEYIQREQAKQTETNVKQRKLADENRQLSNNASGGYGSFNLNGRSVGSGGLPRPSYSGMEEGRIVINITVDPNGNVIKAEIGRGTSIDTPSMRKSALDAARRAKFNKIQGDNNQIGTITYNYKFVN